MLEVLFDECRKRGVRAVHLEVDRGNMPAKALYHKFGFHDHDNQLLSRHLVDRPTTR